MPRTSRTPTLATTPAQLLQSELRSRVLWRSTGAPLRGRRAGPRSSAGRPLDPHRGAAAPREDRRPPPRDRLPAVGPSPDRARPDRRAGRQGDSDAQPTWRHTRDPLPRLRALAPLRELRRRAHVARRRGPALPSLRPSRTGAEDVPRLWLGGARPHRCGHAAARRRSSSGTSRSSRGSGSMPTPPRARERFARRSQRFRKADRAVLVGTQMVAKGHHFPGVDLAAVVDADTGLAFPDFRAEERTFQLVTQLAGRSGRDAPGLVLVQTFQPDAMPFQFAQRHDVAGFLARGARAAHGARLPAREPPRLDRRLRAGSGRGRPDAS